METHRIELMKGHNDGLVLEDDDGIFLLEKNETTKEALKKQLIEPSLAVVRNEMSINEGLETTKGDELGMAVQKNGVMPTPANNQGPFRRNMRMLEEIEKQMGCKAKSNAGNWQTWLMITTSDGAKKALRKIEKELSREPTEQPSYVLIAVTIKALEERSRCESEDELSDEYDPFARLRSYQAVHSENYQEHYESDESADDDSDKKQAVPWSAETIGAKAFKSALETFKKKFEMSNEAKNSVVFVCVSKSEHAKKAFECIAQQIKYKSSCKNAEVIISVKIKEEKEEKDENDDEKGQKLWILRFFDSISSWFHPASNASRLNELWILRAELELTDADALKLTDSIMQYNPNLSAEECVIKAIKEFTKMCSGQ